MTRTSTFTGAARGVDAVPARPCRFATRSPRTPGRAVGLHPATRVGPLVHAWSRSRWSATATCSFPHARRRLITVSLHYVPPQRSGLSPSVLRAPRAFRAPRHIAIDCLPIPLSRQSLANRHPLLTLCSRLLTLSAHVQLWAHAPPPHSPPGRIPLIVWRAPPHAQWHPSP